jgi:hypothetical protein
LYKTSLSFIQGRERERESIDKIGGADNFKVVGVDGEDAPTLGDKGSTGKDCMP